MTDLGLFEILSWVLLGSGTLLSVISGIGLLNMPDFFSRIHAVGLSDALSNALIGIGLLYQMTEIIVAVKLLLILAFLFMTSPVASHALAKAALADGIKPWGVEDAKPGTRCSMRK